MSVHCCPSWPCPICNPRPDVEINITTRKGKRLVDPEPLQARIAELERVLRIIADSNSRSWDHSSMAREALNQNKWRNR